jgi:predicted ATPase/DNA-binding CsgD family transcriptional regulator
MAVGQETISDREAEVLGALAEHLTNAEIAQRLHISIRTVESHVSSLLRKLDVADRRALAALATGEVDDLPPAPRASFAALPTTWSSFVGRSAEVDEVLAALATHRLVTLLGPGGIGKTRLAVVVAEQTAPGPGGARAFVDLLPCTARGMASALAAAVGAVERPNTSIEAVVHERLQERPVLLVLDNCEHVLDAAADWVESALTACPELIVLTTSRERLGLGGERVIAVPPLGDEATELFVERASADAGPTDLDPDVVVEICRRLDGVPLAIELAAARLRSLGLDGLLAGLDDHLRLLGRGGGAGTGGRHRSLRGVIEWSHDLLDDEEQLLFRRLAVFAGPFDLASASEVAAEGQAATASDVIGRLADKSLLVRVQDGSTSRWRMLEVVRAFAWEQLEGSGDEAALVGAHLRWAVATAAALESELGEGDEWMAQFDAVADDLRTALRRRAADERAREPFTLGLSLGHLAYARGLMDEARAHLLAAAERAPDPEGEVVALRQAAWVARSDQRLELNIELLHRTVAAAEASGQAGAAARALADIARELGRFPAGFAEPPDQGEIATLIQRARGLDPGDDPALDAAITLAAAWNGRPGPTEPDPELANDALEKARALGDPLLISEALDAVASGESYAGHRKEFARVTSERLDLVDDLPRHLPSSGLEVFDVFHMVTEAALAVGDLDAAVSAGRRAQAERIDAALPFLAASRLAIPLVLLGQFDEAVVQAERMRESWERSGRPTAGWMTGAVFSAAMVYGLRGEWAAFDDWWALAQEFCERASTNGTRAFVEQRVALHHGRFDTLPTGVGEDVERYDSLFGYGEAIGIEVAVATGASDAEERLLGADPTISEHEYGAAILQRAAGRLHGDPSELEAAAAMFESIGARFERACTLCLLPDRRAEGERELEAVGCPPPMGVG